VYGSISHGLQYGGIAPMETVNQNTVLSPSRSKQFEFGVKRNVNEQLALSGAVFEITQGLEYTNAANVFVRAGEQTHRGVELSAQGRALPGLNYNLSLMALDTNQKDTGDASTEGKRVTKCRNCGRPPGSSTWCRRWRGSSSTRSGSIRATRCLIRPTGSRCRDTTWSGLEHRTCCVRVV
jgi:outer membrane receptor protein involved in Fe transport